MNYSIFASESVASGHPDKICDQISDAVLDEAIKNYPKSRVAVETLVTTNRVVLAGEVTCPKPIEFEKIARGIIKDLGYTKDEYNFTDRSDIKVFVHEQSGDIAQGVDSGGAGDQGMMFGYAVNETPELMPLPIALAHKLVAKLDELRETEILPYLRPDGKSEVCVIYEKGKPVAVDHVVFAAPHNPDAKKEQIRTDLFKLAVLPILETYKIPAISLDKLILNGTGRWEIGGPASDTGVTGRKIVVDTYGGMARIGGGCFSGKDPTKVDRSAAYAARFLAKNIVAAGLAERCEVQLAYVIGYSDPIARAVETFGTEKKGLKEIEDFAWSLLDLSTKGIVEGLNLLQPIYRNTARYGHFGRNEFPWEKIVVLN
ncbi:MAG: methionine adenosyltransferase [Patescibacteria group bacterium]|nr:methionine adenosyltransferase [Patescibacteria group bacterium]